MLFRVYIKKRFLFLFLILLFFGERVGSSKDIFIFVKFFFVFFVGENFGDN